MSQDLQIMPPQALLQNPDTAHSHTCPDQPHDQQQPADDQLVNQEPLLSIQVSQCNQQPAVSVQASQEFFDINSSTYQQPVSSEQVLVEQKVIEPEIKGQSQLSADSEGIAQKAPVEPKPVIRVNLFEERLNKSVEMKNEGNEFFKQKNYVEAIRKYSDALKQLEPNHFYGARQAECEKMAQLCGVLLCNIGYCYFNGHDLQRADIYLTEAIAINPKYIKALHKRAQVRFELGKYEESFQDIKQAFALDKTNQEIFKSYEKILVKYNESVKRSKEEMKELSAKIFRQESQKSESPLKAPEQKEQAPEQKKQVPEQKGKKSKSSVPWGEYIFNASVVGLAGFALYRVFSK